MNGICSHGRKIYTQNCGCCCNDQTVKHARPDRQCSMYQIVPVCQQMIARQCRKPCFQLTFRTRRIDKHDIKPEQAEK